MPRATTLDLSRTVVPRERSTRPGMAKHTEKISEIVRWSPGHALPADERAIDESWGQQNRRIQYTSHSPGHGGVSTTARQKRLAERG